MVELKILFIWCEMFRSLWNTKWQKCHTKINKIRQHCFAMHSSTNIILWCNEIFRVPPCWRGRKSIRLACTSLRTPQILSYTFLELHLTIFYQYLLMLRACIIIKITRFKSVVCKYWNIYRTCQHLRPDTSNTNNVRWYLTLRGFGF